MLKHSALILTLMSIWRVLAYGSCMPMLKLEILHDLLQITRNQFLKLKRGSLNGAISEAESDADEEMVDEVR